MGKTAVKRKGKIQERVFHIVEEDLKIEEEKQKSLSESASKIHWRMFREGQETEAYGTVFWLTVALAQLVAVACIALVAYLGTLYGGYLFADRDLLFNFHPLFMVLGLIVFYGEAIIVYRVLSFLPKLVLKVIHASLHLFALIFSSLALVAVFENHKLTNKPDLYSLHSWLGLIAFTAFCLQYVGGFVAFLFPGIPANWRSKVMPFHTFFGLGIFLMAACSAEMGITEKMLYTTNYSQGIHKGAIGNTLGLLILVFAFLIAHIASRTVYKRKPLPSELPANTMN